MIKKSRCKQNSDAPKGFYKQDNTTPNDVVVLESKQNSDAAGLLYQWGRKDPFTFATKTDGLNNQHNGFNPIKIYNAQGKEIVQHINGGTDNNGGITIVKGQASAMLETVRKPNTFYATGVNNSLINQVGLTQAIWDYYWVSYSRGTDGDGVWQENGNPNWNNIYLDGYNQKRSKSIFDPCPYGFRIPVNGVWNKFISNEWVAYSYMGGSEFDINFKTTWFSAARSRSSTSGICASIGVTIPCYTSTASSLSSGYSCAFGYNNKQLLNYKLETAYGSAVRCIEECMEIKKSVVYGLSKLDVNSLFFSTHYSILSID